MENTFIQRRTYQVFQENLLKRLSDVGNSVRYEKRELIELSGVEAEYIYLICSGYVQQSLISPAGNTLILLFLGPGFLFNDVTLFNNDLNCVLSVAHTDAELRKIPVHEFRKQMEGDLELHSFLAHQMAFKLRLTMALLYDLSFHCVEERLRSMLHRLCVQVGEAVGDEIYIPFPLTHEEFAQAISSTRSSVSRTMKKLQEERSVRIQNRRLYIDPEQLQKRGGTLPHRREMTLRPLRSGRSHRSAGFRGG